MYTYVKDKLKVGVYLSDFRVRRPYKFQRQNLTVTLQRIAS